jgi:RNA recognition motif-containing protein
MADTTATAATEVAAATETPVETPAVETPVETPVENQEGEETNTVSSDGQNIKVFVGNIDYKVTDEQLKEFFKDLKFVDAAINKRKDVSVGYGFITFDDEEEAKKCVEQYDKKDFQGRPLKVELAKEKTETTKRRSSRRNLRGKGRRSNNSFRRRKNANKDKKDSEASADEASSNEEGKNESSGSESNTEGSSKNKSRFRKQKKYRQRKPREGGEPSKTTIYVANLPFKTDDEKLKEAFKDYEVSKVHVARYKGGKSKGFGFIEVENEEEQKKILVECSNKIIDGRAISLKVALNFTKEEAANIENAVETTEAIAVAAEN